MRAFRHTDNQRCHFERCRDWPAGLIVVGDAACAFNPIYGHGMSVAAQTALLLDAALRQAGADRRHFARRFQGDVARASAAAWLIATAEDLRYPTTEGARPSLMTRMPHCYMDRVQATANRDPVVSAAFLDMLGLVAPPASLFKPGIVFRALAQQEAAA